MRLDILYKIKEDPNQIRFLRENSYWYKYLNRSPIYYQDFIQDMKNKYKLNPVDKINRVINNINMLKNLLDII